MSDKITFIATLPPIMSAIRVGMDSARLQLDLAATEQVAIEQLTRLHGKQLSVAIVVVDQRMSEPVDDAAS